jgi:hypothetical protein
MRRERFPFARPMAVRVRARFGRKAGPARSGTRTQVGATTLRLRCLGPVLHDFAGHGARRLESGRDQFAAGDGGRFDGMDSGPWARPVLRVVWDFHHRDFAIHLSEVPGLRVPLHSPRLDHVGYVERWRGASMAGGRSERRDPSGVPHLFGAGTWGCGAVPLAGDRLGPKATEGSGLGGPDLRRFHRTAPASGVAITAHP